VARRETLPGEMGAEMLPEDAEQAVLGGFLVVREDLRVDDLRASRGGRWWRSTMGNATARRHGPRVDHDFNLLRTLNERQSAASNACLVVAFCHCDMSRERAKHAGLARAQPDFKPFLSPSNSRSLTPPRHYHQARHTSE